MADDQKKNKPAGTQSAGTPSTEAKTADDAPKEETSSQGEPSPQAGAATTARTPAPTAAGGMAQPRPVTTTPAPGSPTTDRLSLDPERPHSTVERAKSWVEENPALAILGAAALGLVIGRAVIAILPKPEPETLKDKIEKRARELAEQGRYYADDAGETISEQLSVAAEALGEAAKVVAKGAKHGYEEAKDFSETVVEAIGHAFSKKASEWLDKMN